MPVSLGGFRRGFQRALSEGFVSVPALSLTAGASHHTQGDGRVTGPLITAGSALVRIRRADKGEMVENRELVALIF